MRCSNARLVASFSACLLACVSAYGALPVETSGALGQLYTVAAAGERGGFVMEGAPARPALAVPAPMTGARGAGLLADEPLAPGTKTGIPAPQTEPDGKPMAQEYCQGFFGCMGAALVAPVKWPVLCAFMLGVAGSDVGLGVGGKAASVLGAVAGGLMGLIGGIILAPIAVAGGVYRAIKALFKGNKR